MSRQSPKALLDRFNLHAKKNLGQCFLHDPQVISRIIQSIPSDKAPIVEVGPGLGALTLPLLALDRRVIAIDRDNDMINVISELNQGDASTHRGILETIQADILTIDLNALAKKQSTANTGIHVVGNLPYNISSQIIFQLLNSRRVINTATIMIQKELADRLVAKPGTKQYGIPTVLCAQYTTISTIVQASRGAFYPPPRVDSTVIQLDFSRGNAFNIDEHILAQVVRAAFGARRKTIKRSLALTFSAEKVKIALEAAGIDPVVRAEALPLASFVDLARAMGTLCEFNTP